MAGFISGFVDRFQTLQDEKRVAAAEKAVALEKAARQRIEDHMKLAPPSDYASGMLNVEDNPAPDYMPETYRKAISAAGNKFKKDKLVNSVGDYLELHSKGEVPEYKFGEIHVRMKRNDPTLTPTQRNIHMAIIAGIRGEHEAFNKYGGYKVWEKTSTKNREKIRRKGVTDTYGKDRSDLFSYFGKIGESIVLPNKLMEKSSLYGGMSSGQFNININTDSNVSTTKAQQEVHNADQLILKRVNNLLKNDKELRKAFSENRGGIRTHFKEHFDSVAGKPPVLTYAGQSSGNTDWLSSRLPELAKAINEKTVPINGRENTIDVDAQLGKSSTKVHTDFLRRKMKNSPMSRNIKKISQNSVIRNENVIANSLLLEKDVSLIKVNGKWSLPQNIGVAAETLEKNDPLNSGLTYRQSFAIKGAFNAFENGDMKASEYLNFVKAQMPKLMRQSTTNIESNGQIFEMTANAIEANSIPFETEVYTVQPLGTFKNYAPNPVIIENRYDGTKSAHRNEMLRYEKTGKTLGEISDELKTILGYISDSGRLDGIDFGLIDKQNLTGFSSELIQRIDNFKIEAGEFIEGIKGRFFNPDGEDSSLTTALENDQLSPNNRRQLRNISERAKRLAELGDRDGLSDRQRRTYQRRAILEFKKLALTYKMSGLVQGEATGGRTISNQDFEVMLKALWGTQEASKARLQSLLQRIGTARAANKLQQAQFRRGTKEIMLSDRKMDQLRFAMYNDFHKKMQTTDTGAVIVKPDGRIEGENENFR